MSRRLPLLWPERQRCERCHGYFGPTILAGRWCSYECAGHPAPSQYWRDWPRQHFRRDHRGAHTAKTYHQSIEQALLAALAMPPGLEAYLCDYCLLWHIGRSHAAGETETPPPAEVVLTSQQDEVD